MIIHDISQPLLTCRVFHGDTAPTVTLQKDIVDAGYRVTDINMCLHNGTHIDAPSHFVADGLSIDSVQLDSCVGKCTVVRVDRDIDDKVVDSIDDVTRVLFDGKGLIVASGATRLVERGCKLVGIARASVADTNNCTAVHTTLLSNNVVIVEGLVLAHVQCQEYTLVALPLNIHGCEASPVRAILIQE